MIESVKQVKTMKAIDLPPTFDVRVGNFSYPMEFLGAYGQYVYLKSTDTDETIYINRNKDVTILVPDTWENAAVDIEFDLMLQGII